LRKYLEGTRKTKEDRPFEEKHKEFIIKCDEQKLYNTCVFNGSIEKVSNFLIEPPGLFRGRGDHPCAGFLKGRIVPEFVSLNISDKDPIPICNVAGHGWKDIQPYQGATWLATYRDERSGFLLSKYCYLAANSSLKQESDYCKYERARELKTVIDKVRQAYHQLMQSSDQ
jgi:DNA topoisomerase-1